MESKLFLENYVGTLPAAWQLEAVTPQCLFHTLQPTSTRRWSYLYVTTDACDNKLLQLRVGAFREVGGGRGRSRQGGHLNKWGQNERIGINCQSGQAWIPEVRHLVHCGNTWITAVPYRDAELPLQCVPVPDLRCTFDYFVVADVGRELEAIHLQPKVLPKGASTYSETSSSVVTWTPAVQSGVPVFCIGLFSEAARRGNPR